MEWIWVAICGRAPHRYTWKTVAHRIIWKYVIPSPVLVPVLVPCSAYEWLGPKHTCDLFNDCTKVHGEKLICFVHSQKQFIGWIQNETADQSLRSYNLICLSFCNSTVTPNSKWQNYTLWSATPVIYSATDCIAIAWMIVWTIFSIVNPIVGPIVSMNALALHSRTYYLTNSSCKSNMGWKPTVQTITQTSDVKSLNCSPSFV